MFSKALLEGLIFGGAYIRRGLSTEGNLRLKIDQASLIVGRTITAAGNRTCINDFKSQTILTLLLRNYELTNENVSYFLTNQSQTKTFIDLEVTRKPKSTKNSTRPYLYEIPAYFTHEIKTKGYDVIGVNVFPRK